MNKQRSGPTQALADAVGYTPPEKRDGCGRCKHSRVEPGCLRMRCHRQRPLIIVSKLGTCRYFSRAN